MDTDKKITDLAHAQAISGNDVGVMASGDSDYQFTFATLLQYVGSNLNTRASAAFGALLPQNTQGQDGDLFINTATNSFAQKINGAWQVKYQYQPMVSNSMFGLGVPNNNAGSNNDVYVNTATGIFYKKTNGNWQQVFSMQSGPAGPPGFKGDAGPAGNNGNAVLSGTTNPSNLTTGANGDFYLNTSTGYFFGPKVSGTWPAGKLLVQPSVPLSAIKIDIVAGVTTSPFIYNYDGSIGDDPNPRIKLKNADGSYSFDDSIAIDHSADGALFTVTGQPNGAGKFLYSYQFILYPGGYLVYNTPTVNSPVSSTFPFTIPYLLNF